MEPLSKKLKKVLGDDTAIFALIHPNGAPGSSIIVDGQVDLFAETLLNIVLSENVDHAQVRKYIWDVLRQATINIIAYNPTLAKDWMDGLNFVRTQINKNQQAN